MAADAGAGPRPIPYKEIDTQKLIEGIGYCLTSDAYEAAQGIAAKMAAEDGVAAAVRSFHAHLPKDMSCGLLPDQPAAWKYKKGFKRFKLSTVAAQILLEQKEIRKQDLTMYASPKSPLALPFRPY